MPIFLRNISSITYVCWCLFVIGSFVLAFGGCGNVARDDLAAMGDDEEIVFLTISFNGHHPEIAQLRMEIAYENEMTVLSAMKNALKDGKTDSNLKFKYSGDGETAFVRSIEGIGNQGIGKDNWIYYVNKKLGNKSSGVFKLYPGDRVDWQMGEYSVAQ